jgi:hypothetical protein
MFVTIIHEAGYYEALLGLGLSYGKTSDMNFEKDRGRYLELKKRMHLVAERLANKDGGHNKFLESMIVWLDIKAPRYWWQEFDTYRVGITKQSESTIHTVKNRYPLTFSDFEDITLSGLEAINLYIREGDFRKIKNELPEGFLQRRIVCTNYKVLRNMFAQRRYHRLEEWHLFIDIVSTSVEHPEFLEDVA